MSAAPAGGGSGSGGVVVAAPPSSAGATGGAQESITHRLHLPWWPQGDPGRLRVAAAAYRAAAAAITDAAELAQRGIGEVTSVNSGGPIEAMGARWVGVYYGRLCLSAPTAGAPALDNAAATCRLLALACEDYAGQIESARRRLEQLAAELVAGLVVGGLLTFVTAGLSDAAAAANAARVLTAALELADTVGSLVAVAFRVGGLAVQGALVGAGSDLTMQTMRVSLDPQASLSVSELEQAGGLGAVAAPAFRAGGAALSRLPAFAAGRRSTIGLTLDELTTLGTSGELLATTTLTSDAAATAGASGQDLATATGKAVATHLPPSATIADKGYTLSAEVGLATESNLASVTKHLDSIDALASHPPNAAMVARIQEAMSSGRAMTPGEQNFMTHELTEADLMSGGVEQDLAHEMAGQTHPTFSNYDPEVIKQFPEHFNSNWRAYWGLP